MVPARNLHLPRDAHGATPFAAAVLGVTAAPPSVHMAQEPLDQHRVPSKQPPPPPPQEDEGRADRPESRSHREEAEQEQLTPRPFLPATGAVVLSQEAAGTSGSSSGASSGNGGAAAGGWLSLGLAPASSSPSGVAVGASAGSQSQLDFFSDHRAGPLVQRPLPLPGEGGQPPGVFLRPAVQGIPQASITLPALRAGPPWLPPWSHAAGFMAPPPTTMLPFAHRTFYTPGAGAGASGVDTMRVVLPPAGVAAAAGVWFVLQAAPHQGREPFLPQIPRSYLRIKDVRVTVGLLIKYLVSKLGLEDESEVEIICRGRPLLPFLTLQQVRDSIWCQQGDVVVSPLVAPDVSVTNHLMVLQYGRRP